MVITYLQQRLRSPSFPRREFPEFEDLTIVDHDTDSEDEADEGIDDSVGGSSSSSSNGWSTLPHILLEDILAYVPQKDRHAAALVCRRWAETFSAPRVWRKIEIHPNSFMCKKMRFRRTSHGNGRYQKTYVTEQKVDSPQLFQDCIKFIGRYVKCVDFFPMTDCRKIVEMLTALRSFKKEEEEEEEADDEGFEDPGGSESRLKKDEEMEKEAMTSKPLERLEEFAFRYAFDTIETCYEGTQVLGTGGTVLEQLKLTIGVFKQLKLVQLHNLFLDADDGEGILNSFSHCSALTQIDAFNLTKEAATTIDFTLFPHLKTLLLSPLQLTEELTESLTEAASLQRLDIVVDEYSNSSIQVIDKGRWAAVKDAKPNLELRLESRGNFHGDLPIIANAPVTHVIYRNSDSVFSLETIKPVIECYKATLMCYAHVYLPCTHLTKASANHTHAALLELARQCPRLTVIAVRDMIFSSTILHLLKTYPNIKTFLVRRGALLMKNVFSLLHDRCLSSEDHRFLRYHSSSVRNLRRGVDQILQTEIPWRPLSEAGFKRCFN